MFKSLLIANRGEIAIRIARACADMGIQSVAVYSADDASALHTRVADLSIELPGEGAPAYLNMDNVIAAATSSGCDAIHPGYGFLSEQAEFAEKCQAAGLTFIGPSVEKLALFGDKARARAAATAADVPVLNGIDRAVTLDEARAFFTESGGAMIIKAIAGGGGRGTRAVTDESELEATFERCQREARAAFGIEDVYVEEFVPLARHIEVQIAGDTTGKVVHLYERECSVQRQNQKVVEIAPAPGLDEGLRDQILAAAERFAAREQYTSLGTFEFLVDISGRSGAKPFVFIEANARLQVEHTVTEEVTAFDLVQTQIQLAAGYSLDDLGLDVPPIVLGSAIQARVNMETVKPNGTILPRSGRLKAYDAPNGPGIRTDGAGYSGYQTSTAFDSLLAKVIAYSPQGFAQASQRLIRALEEFRIEGLETNLPFLQNIIHAEDFAESRVHTRWVDEHCESLGQPFEGRSRFIETPPEPEPAPAPEAPQTTSTDAETAPAMQDDGGYAGARIDSSDPLALFAHDEQVKANQAEEVEAAEEVTSGPEGTYGQLSPIQGTIVSIDVSIDDEVMAGQALAIVEAMKMEHVITADRNGIVREITMSAGDVVRESYPLVFIEEADVSGDLATTDQEVDLDYIRPDLEENIRRHAFTLDENREAAVEKRYARGSRMPRENIAELADPGSFKEYWPLVVARQHRRRDMEALRTETPGDGVVAGTCSINGELFPADKSRAMIVHYDYTVLAGTQGARNHYKQDRLFELAHRFRLPMVLFGEGGGGRPGDDPTGPSVAFDTTTFTTFAKLSGLVPLVSVVNGRTFAGNTALVACSDVIIATENATLGMGGPAMIEGGGLGIYTPEEVGPMSVQVPNGVVDVLVKDEAEACEVAKKYLSYFQGPLPEWQEADQRVLRHVIPENRLRLYDMREIIRTIADEGSVLELREQFGIGVITAFIRVAGRPMGVIANNPHHLAGAIDSDGADKGARFMQLCDAFDIPILSLIDCPGMMVGPEVEKTALVRHCVRMFNTGSNITVPLFSVVVRKAYGLGAQAMCGAGALVGFFTIAWPTAEFAGMNIEGSVKLGYRKELAAIEDPDERRVEFENRVARAYESAKAVNAAVGGGLDDVIDPADTRDWIVSSLDRVPPAPPRQEKKYAFVDTW